jgi:hypothetical protein
MQEGNQCLPGHVPSFPFLVRQLQTTLRLEHSRGVPWSGSHTVNINGQQRFATYAALQGESELWLRAGCSILRGNHVRGCVVSCREGLG